MTRNLMIACGWMLLSVVCWADEAPQVVTVDKAAPDFAATGIDDKQFKLSDITAKGKNIVLLFSRAHW